MTNTIYQDGTYGTQNPGWHTFDSAWKAQRISELLRRNGVEFASCVEVGCGGGQVIAHLAAGFPGRAYVGYDVSPAAERYWSSVADSGVEYRRTDFTDSSGQYDLLLLIDVLEHVDDYLGFLRKLVSRASWFVFHVPLEMNVSAILRDRQLHSRERVGHLHYFSRATALAVIRDAGYSIIDDELTKLSQQTVEGRTGLTRVANAVRRSIEWASIDLSARLLGGYSLLVLAKASGAHPPQGEIRGAS